MMADGSFDITATERPNQAPTGATITGATTLVAPNTVTLEATAMDADTGTTLTYAWAITTDEGGTITLTGASATYTPPTIATGAAARDIVITLTVSDDDATPLTATATHTITVNPPVAANTPPAFTNSFTTPIEAAENQTAAGVANFFVAPGSGTVTLTLGGADMALFTLDSATGTLTFNDAPNFEMPRGTPITGTNTNDYALTVSAMNTVGTTPSGAITVRVTDVNEAPESAAITIAGGATMVTNPATLGVSATATDPDAGATLTYTWSSDATSDSFSPTTGANVTWTPPTVTAATMVTLTVTVSDGATPPLTTTATQAVTVNAMPAAGPDTAPTFGAATVSPQVFTIGTAVDLTLPVATGGNGAITYALTPVTPAGLTFNPTARTITGTPNTLASATTYTYTAGDTDGSAAGTDEVSLMFSITVNEMTVTPTIPTFGDATIDDMTYTQGTTITPVTLPVATGGFSATLFYSVLPDPPAGLTFTRSTRVLSGTPTTVGMTTHSYRVADIRARAVALMFTITVNAPAGGGTPPTSQTLTINPTAVTESATPTNITATVTLNGGTFTVARAFSIGTQGGNAAVDDDYAAVNLTLTLPANTASGSLVIPFTAVLDTVAEPAGETVNIASGLLNLAENGRDLTISGAIAPLTINDPSSAGTDTAPTFVGATIEAQTFTQGTAITPLPLPAATGGNGPIAYTLTPAIPGLRLNSTTRVLTGTPTTAGVTEVTYTAADSDDNVAASDTDTLTFTITVSPAPDTTPVFTSPNLAAFEPGGMPLEFEVAENTLAVNVANFFAATTGVDGEPAMVTLSGPDASFFSIDDGTLTFNDRRRTLRCRVACPSTPSTITMTTCSP